MLALYKETLFPRMAVTSLIHVFGSQQGVNEGLCGDYPEMLTNCPLRCVLDVEEYVHHVSACTTPITAL